MAHLISLTRMVPGAPVPGPDVPGATPEDPPVPGPEVPGPPMQVEVVVGLECIVRADPIEPPDAAGNRSSILLLGATERLAVRQRLGEIRTAAAN